MGRPAVLKCDLPCDLPSNLYPCVSSLSALISYRICHLRRPKQVKYQGVFPKKSSRLVANMMYSNSSACLEPNNTSLLLTRHEKHTLDTDLRSRHLEHIVLGSECCFKKRGTTSFGTMTFEAFQRVVHKACTRCQWNTCLLINSVSVSKKRMAYHRLSVSRENVAGACSTMVSNSKCKRLIYCFSEGQYSILVVSVSTAHPPLTLNSTEIS